MRSLKPSFLHYHSVVSPHTDRKYTLRKPEQIATVNVVSWMEIYTEMNRVSLLHQAELSVRHRRTPVTTTKDHKRVLPTMKSAGLVKRYGEFIRDKRIKTAESRSRNLPTTQITLQSRLFSDSLSPTSQIPKTSHCIRRSEIPFSDTTQSQFPQKTSFLDNFQRNTKNIKVTCFDSTIIPDRNQGKFRLFDLRKYLKSREIPVFKC